METQWLPVSLVVWITALAGTLDARQQVRFVALCTGLLFARGRRTSPLAAPVRAGRDSRYYYLLGSVGRKALAIAGVLLRILLAAPGRWAGHAAGLRHRRLAHQAVRAARRGRRSHNPTPGPAGPRSSTATSGSSGPPGPTLALGSHRPADPLALVRPAKDVSWMAAYYGWQFHTKLELAAAQIECWSSSWARSPADLGGNRRAYVKRPFFKRCWLRASR